MKHAFLIRQLLPVALFSVLPGSAALAAPGELAQTPLALGCSGIETITSVATTSTRPAAKPQLFQAQFDPTRWSGDLKASELSSNQSLSQQWSAADLLDSRNLSSAPRNIVTFDSSKGIFFDSAHWDDLTTVQKADLCAIGRDWSAADALPPTRLPGWSSGCYLDADGTIAGDTTLARRLVDYLAGDRGNEGNGPDEFRPRDSRLGDIVHSTPLFVGKPRARYPDNIESTPYSTFVSANASRPGTVYVGANDGMLHAFDAETGNERFAYMPSALFSAEERRGLHYLAEQQAPNAYAHRFYVDLTPASADVFIDDEWRTVLVGGLRAGGRAVFALDITDPAATATSRPMWEFSHADLGHTFSEIAIGRMNNGRWAAIFGNGYDQGPNGAGTAQLFIVDIASGQLIKKIDTGLGSITNSSCAVPASDCNGLSSPRVADLDGNGTIVRIWAGDLQGRLWVFNVASAQTTEWGIGHNKAPLFRACRGNTCTIGNRQPITVRPAIARHPTVQRGETSPNIMVYFGTGQYLTEADNTSTATQSVYGVWDTGDGPAATLSRSDLVAQTVAQDTINSGGDITEVRTLSNHQVDYSGTPPNEYGWYIDLPALRERVITSPYTLGKVVWFNTFIPDVSDCDANGGWLMVANQLNGGEPLFAVVDVDGNGVFDTHDMVDGKPVARVKVEGVPSESLFFLDLRITATEETPGVLRVEKIQSLPPSIPGRMSWTHLRRH